MIDRAHFRYVISTALSFLLALLQIPFLAATLFPTLFAFIGQKQISLCNLKQLDPTQELRTDGVHKWFSR